MSGCPGWGQEGPSPPPRGVPRQEGEQRAGGTKKDFPRNLGAPESCGALLGCQGDRREDWVYAGPFWTSA